MTWPPTSLTRKAEALQKRIGLSYDHLLGFRFAVNALLATTIVWYTLKLFGEKNAIWAITSMVAASEPVLAEARRLFRRLVNVLVGCAVGLCLLLVDGHSTG
jgi:hypothetical protein